MLRMITFLFVVLDGLHGRLARLGRPGLGLTAGQQSPPPGGGSASEQPSSLAYATLGLGIASWFVLPIAGAVLGAILGWMELRNIKQGKSPAAGESITKVGFWLSVVHLLLAVVGSCITIAVVFVIFGGFAAAISAAGLSQAAAP